MFDVSFTELMVIGVVALIVIGPERLPRVAKTIGHLLGRAQRYVSDVKGDIRREIELDDLRKFKSEMDDAAHSVQSSLRDTEKSLRSHSDELRDVLDQTAKDAQAGLNGVASASPLSGAASIPSAALGKTGSAVSAGASNTPSATPDPAAPSTSPTAAFPTTDSAESLTPDAPRPPGVSTTETLAQHRALTPEDEPSPVSAATAVFGTGDTSADSEDTSIAGTNKSAPVDSISARAPSAPLTAKPARADDWPPPPTWSKP